MRDNEYFIECVGPGWQPIVKGYLDKLDELVATYPGSSYKVYQVKEKFGELRLYVEYNGGDEFTAQAFEAGELAESTTNRTCETCGEPGKWRNTSWMKTLCEKHYNEWSK